MIRFKIFNLIPLKLLSRVEKNIGLTAITNELR